MDNNCKNNFRNIEDNIMAVIKAYNKGTGDGYSQGYKQGIEDGNIADGTLEKKIKEAYENGLKDAWSATRKVILADDGGAAINKIQAIFNASPYGVIKGFEAKEVIEKLNEAHENSYAEWIKDYKRGLCICPTCGNEQRFLTDRCSKCGQLMKDTEREYK